MKEKLIIQETAVLAKKVGFNPETMNYYHDDSDVLFEGTWDNGPINYNTDEDYTGTSAASTQSLLQKWLREVHQIHIAIYPIKNFWECDIRDCWMKKIVHESLHTFTNHETYESALEEALLFALLLVPKKP